MVDISWITPASREGRLAWHNMWGLNTAATCSPQSCYKMQLKAPSLAMHCAHFRRIPLHWGRPRE